MGGGPQVPVCLLAPHLPFALLVGVMPPTLSYGPIVGHVRLL
jgi:hypothetical protein